jgi:hypothetical protein
VQTEDRVDGEAFEQAVIQQRARAGADLLGGLKHEMQRALEITGFGQSASRGEQNRRVAVMPAGVHGRRSRSRNRARSPRGSAARRSPRGWRAL